MIGPNKSLHKSVQIMVTVMIHHLVYMYVRAQAHTQVACMHTLVLKTVGAHHVERGLRGACVCVVGLQPAGRQANQGQRQGYNSLCTQGACVRVRMRVCSSANARV